MALPLLDLQSTREVPQEARGKVSSLNEYRHERMTEEREKRDGTEKQIEYGVTVRAPRSSIARCPHGYMILESKFQFSQCAGPPS